MLSESCQNPRAFNFKSIKSFLRFALHKCTDKQIKNLKIIVSPTTLIKAPNIFFSYIFQTLIPYDFIISKDTQSVPVNATGCGFDAYSRKRHNCLNFFVLVSRKTRRWVQPFNMQCLQNSAERGERGVLRLGSLCLPCVRDTACNWYIFFNRWTFLLEAFVWFYFYCVYSCASTSNSIVST